MWGEVRSVLAAAAGKSSDGGCDGGRWLSMVAAAAWVEGLIAMML